MGAHGADAAQAAAALLEELALRAARRVRERKLLDAAVVVLLYSDGGYCAVTLKLERPTYLDDLLGDQGIDAYSVRSDNPPWALAYMQGDRLVVLGKGEGDLNDALRRLYWAILASGEERLEYGRTLPLS